MELRKKGRNLKKIKGQCTKRRGEPGLELIASNCIRPDISISLPLGFLTLLSSTLRPVEGIEVQGPHGSSNLFQPSVLMIRMDATGSRMRCWCGGLGFDRGKFSALKNTTSSNG